MSLSWCSVIGCKNEAKNGYKGYYFPIEVNLKSKWIQFCGLQKSWTPEKLAMICSAHFRDSDFVSVRKGKLKDGTVPSIKVD